MKLITQKILLIIIALFFFSPIFATEASSDVIMQAMRDELKRSMQSLKLESLDKPYYIEYILKVQNDKHCKGVLGDLIENKSSKNVYLTVGVRIGDYSFDNSNFFDVGFSFFGSTDDEENFQNRSIPEELNYDVLRHELWLATDAAYKRNSEIYSKKIASLKNIIRKDTIPDFAKVDIHKSFDTIKVDDFNLEKYSNLIKKLSEIFKNYPNISVSQVSFEYLPTRIYYINSEGIEYIKDDYFSGIEAVAYIQTPSGTPLIEHYSTYSMHPENLPTADSLTNAIKDISDKLNLLVSKNSLEETYNGPVLFDEQAACQVFAQSFIPNLVAQRQPLSEGFSFGMGNKTTTFQKKIGGRVLPEFLSVFDSPIDAKYKKTELLGYYKFDDDGVPSNRTTVVENGFLKTLLTDRTPIKRVLQSNAHKRRGGALFSNIFIFPDPMKAVPTKDLKQKLLDLVKQRDLPFGIIVRKVIDQNIFSTNLMSTTYGQISYFIDQNTIPIIEAYKVYPDGKEELIRNTQINSLSAQSFKDIIFIGKDSYVLNYLAPAVVNSFMSGGDAYVGSSIISPPVIFEDLEINPIDKDTPKPPYIPNPLVKKK
jgi:hypothetical protein